MSTPLYPEITVQLTDGNGNAFAIIGAVQKALRQNGVNADTISEFVHRSHLG